MTIDEQIKAVEEIIHKHGQLIYEDSISNHTHTIKIDELATAIVDAIGVRMKKVQGHQ